MVENSIEPPKPFNRYEVMVHRTAAFLRWPPISISSTAIAGFVTVNELPATAQGWGLLAVFFILLNAISALPDLVVNTAAWLLSSIEAALQTLSRWTTNLRRVVARLRNVLGPKD